MEAKDIRQILHDPQFQKLAAAKSRVGWTLTIIMLVIYFGYLTLVSVNPALLHQSLSGGITTVGIPLGVAVIVSAIVLSGIYVWYANNHFDKQNEAVVKEFNK